MQVTKLTSLFSRAKQIYLTEGLIPLVKRVSAFLVHCFFEYGSYWLYDEPIRDTLDFNKADFLPKIDSFTFKIVCSNQEADDLEAEGLEFRSQFTNAWESIDKGAVAFCIFVGHELANIGWLAMNQQAKDSLKALPVKVEFSENEAYRGGSWTNLKYRGMDLHSYNLFKRLEFSRDKAIASHRAVVHKENTASQSAQANVGAIAYAEARYLKILWWKSWKERPLSQG